MNSEIKVRIMSLKSGFWEKKVWIVKTVAQSSFVGLDLHGKCKYISIIDLYQAFAFWHCNVANKGFGSIFPDYPDICLTSETNSPSALIMLREQMLFSLHSLSTVKAPLDDGWFSTSCKENPTSISGFVLQLQGLDAAKQSHYGHHVSQINVRSMWRASKQNVFIINFVCVVYDML